MACSACDAGTVAVAVPDDLREYAAAAIDTASTNDADGPSIVTVCPSCLRIQDAPERSGGVVTDTTGDVGAISDALPADEDAATALLLAASLLDSVASNRRAIEALVERAERAGVDPALAFERLAADPDLDPAVDLPRRYRQFEQMRG